MNHSDRLDSPSARPPGLPIRTAIVEDEEDIRPDEGADGELRQELDEDQGLKTTWYKVAEPDDLREGEVRTVSAGTESIALTFYQGEYGALNNACPHQGGPLADGTLEDGRLRCPWHG